jgi:hypothetical protein
VVQTEKKRRIRFHHFSWTFTGNNMQISGHRNVQSVNTYSRLNQNQQKSISKVLSDTEGKVVFDKGKPSENTNSNNSVRSFVVRNHHFVFSD